MANIKKQLRVGIDNYSLHPLRLSPLEMLKWAHENGAEGVAFSGLTRDQYAQLTASDLQGLAAFAADIGLYLEWGGGQHIPRDMETWESRDIFEHNRARAAEAKALGVSVIRSCSGGLMRWNAGSPSTRRLMEETAKTLAAQRSMLEDHNVILAMETHFEFTSFELLAIFEMAGLQPGGCAGICLDTMNLLVMLEDPLEAAGRLLPWVVSTHIKDGGLLLNDAGLHPFPVPLGQGIVDIAGIINLLRSQPQRIDLSIEDHGGSFDLPVERKEFITEFPDLRAAEYARLMQLAVSTAEKMRKEALHITSREDWPDICGKRSAKNIRVLKKLAAIV